MKGRETYRSSQEDFERYLQGEMSEEQKHHFERASLEDAFEQEALEGWEDQYPAVLRKDLEQLRSKIHAKKKTRIPYWQIAAAATLLLAATLVTWQVLLQEPEPLATSETKSEKVTEEKTAVEAASDDAGAEPLSVTTEQELPDATAAEPELAEEEKPVAASEKQQPPPGQAEPEVTPQPARRAAAVAKRREEPRALPVEELGEIQSEETVLSSEGFFADAELLEGDAEEVGASADEPPADAFTADDQLSDLGSKLQDSMGTGLSFSVTQPLRPDSILISGIVMDPYNRVVSDVDVIVEGTDLRTKSDVNGRYELKLPDDLSDKVLLYEHSGFATEERKADSDELDVTLQSKSAPDALTVGSAPSARAAFQADYEADAQPAGGQKAYKKYLVKERKRRYRGEPLGSGTVVVMAQVETDGTLSDLIIEEGLDDATNEAALTLIRMGPRWEPAYQAGKPVQSTVRIPVEFP